MTFQRYIDKPLEFFVTEEQIAIKPNNDKSNIEIANWLTQHIFTIIKDIEHYNEVDPKVLLK